MKLNYSDVNALTNREKALEDELESLQNEYFHSDNGFIRNWERQCEILEELDDIEDKVNRTYYALVTPPWRMVWDQMTGTWTAKVVLAVVVCFTIYWGMK